MHIAQRNAISTSAAAAVVVVLIVVIAGGLYFGGYIGGTNGTTSTTSSSSSTTSSIASSSTTTSSLTSTSTSTTQTPVPLTLQAGGSSFVNPAMQVWAAGFQDFSGQAVKTNYQPVGSGAGITGVLKGTFDFAGSDAPVSASVLANYTAANGPLLTIPESLGAVAIFYNIPGVTTSLNLTGTIIAKIYLEQITSWNDSAILAINSGVNASALAHQIIPVHRSDGSGTTYALSNYFTKVSTDWNASGKAFGTTISWPNSPNPELAGRGSAGVAGLVSLNKYSVGYADSYYASSNHLLSAAVQNQAGKFLTPSLAGVSAAAAQFSAQLQVDPTTSITNAPGDTSYPISTFTYLLVWQNQSNQGKGLDIALFFWWIVTHGQALAPPVGYPALPTAVVTLDETLIAKMNFNGTPFITG